MSSVRIGLLHLFLFLVLAPEISAQPAWFVTTPAGAPVQGDGARFRPPATEGEMLADELHRLARRDEELFPVDLSRYQLVGLSGPFRLQVGRQNLPEDGLMLRNHPRQGFSLRARGGPLNAAIRGFVLQTEPESIPGDALGLGNDHNRLGGITGEISPWPDAPVQVRFRGGYLSGTRPGWNPYDPQQGDAWSMGAEAEVGRNLVLRGELAGSRFDYGSAWEEQEGKAAVFLARYGSVLRPESARPVEWHLGVENSHVDPGFYSMGNGALVSDRDQVRFFAGVRRDRVRLVGNLSRERNNLDDLHHRPTTESADHSLVLTYHHLDPIARFSRFGTPRHSMTFDGFARRPKSDIEDERQRIHYRIDFSRENWEWGAGYRFSAYRDHLASWRDTDEQSIDLRLEMRLAGGVFLAPFAELGIVKQEGVDFDTRRLGLRGTVVLIPDRLRTGWDAELSSRELPGEMWEKNSSLSGEIVCTLRAAGGGRSGLLLSLSGNRREWESPFYPADREYRLFLNLSTTLSTS